MKKLLDILVIYSSFIYNKINSKIWVKALLILIAFALYGNTLNYQYTLDDDVFVLGNSSVQKGFDGLGEVFRYGSMEKYNGSKGLQPYRPIVLAFFAVEKQFFNNNASISHLINVILYALILIVLFNLLIKLLPNKNIWMCSFIVILFAAHPIHTEVVASVKSRDELLSSIFSLLALSFAISSISSNRYLILNTLISFLCFCLAIFSKESTIAMILIFPLTFCLLLKKSAIKSILYSIPYIIIALGFIILRHKIIGNQVNNYQTTISENVLFGANGIAELTASKIQILFLYFKILLIPWPLSWDYSYNQIPLINWTSYLPWLSLFLHLGLFYYAILNVKRNPIFTFAILFHFITLAPTGNLFFLIGTTFAERLLFLPSLGFVIAIVYVINEIFKLNTPNFIKKWKYIPTTFVIIIFIFYSSTTINRSQAWQSNFTLFKSGVQNSPNSTKTNAAWAYECRTLGENERDVKKKIAYFTEAIQYYKKSLIILPSNYEASFNLGLTYEEFGDTINAIKTYISTINNEPKHLFALTNIGVLYASQNKLDTAATYLKRSYNIDSTSLLVIENLSLIYFLMGKYNSAILYANKAISINTNTVKSYAILKNTYQQLGNFNEARKYLKLYNEYSN
jgi:tetratricopeptide (TPR) repeat protein